VHGLALRPAAQAVHVRDCGARPRRMPSSATTGRTATGARALAFPRCSARGTSATWTSLRRWSARCRACASTPSRASLRSTTRGPQRPRRAMRCATPPGTRPRGSPPARPSPCARAHALTRRAALTLRAALSAARAQAAQARGPVCWHDDGHERAHQEAAGRAGAQVRELALLGRVLARQGQGARAVRQEFPRALALQPPLPLLPQGAPPALFRDRR